MLDFGTWYAHVPTDLLVILLIRVLVSEIAILSFLSFLGKKVLMWTVEMASWVRCLLYNHEHPS